jgi:hypothetical protein
MEPDLQGTVLPVEDRPIFAAFRLMSKRDHSYQKPGSQSSQPFSMTLGVGGESFSSVLVSILRLHV